MHAMSVLKWLVILVVIVLVGWYFLTPTPQATTVELEANGGFAYMQPTANVMEIAFLPEIRNATTNCFVPASQVELWVVRGNVVAPSYTPEKRRFDLRHTTVRFADLDASTDPLMINRGAPPTTAPFG